MLALNVAGVRGDFYFLVERCTVNRSGHPLYPLALYCLNVDKVYTHTRDPYLIERPSLATLVMMHFL